MQLWSRLFIPTLREAPADAEVASHKFLVRAGYIRQLSAGIYSYLYLGQRAILKITDVVRQEMDTIGQEFFLPALHPREIWEASGRWTGMGDNMFRLKDRKGADYCPTSRARNCEATSSFRRSGTRFRPSSATSRVLSQDSCGCGSSP